MKDSYENQLILLLESAMKYNGVSYPQVAQLLVEDGKKPFRQSVFKKAKSGTMKVTTLLKILDRLGVELKLTKDGKEVPVRSAVGDRTIRTVKGIAYDTKHCCPVANSFYADGENKYRGHQAEELYYDPKTGKYVLVHYCEEGYLWKKKCPWIEVVEEDKVNEYIKQYDMK